MLAPARLLATILARTTAFLGLFGALLGLLGAFFGLLGALAALALGTTATALFAYGVVYDFAVGFGFGVAAAFGFWGWIIGKFIYYVLGSADCFKILCFYSFC